MIENSYLSLGPHSFHRIAYTEWGRRNNPHVIMYAHGLTRNGRDFDALAGALKAQARILCKDVVGRGRSDWLEHKEDYIFHQYQADAATLIARASEAAPRPPLRRLLRPSQPDRGAVKIDWVGTSMGGLIGMLIAAQPHSPIRRLVLNDVGPFIPWAALIRLKGQLLIGPILSSSLLPSSYASSPHPLPPILSSTSKTVT